MVLPVHPRTRQAMTHFGLDFAANPCNRSGGLHRHGATAPRLRARDDGFGRAPEGSLFCAQALHHDARRDRMGRDGDARLEPTVAAVVGLVKAENGHHGLRQRRCRAARATGHPGSSKCKVAMIRFHRPAAPMRCRRCAKRSRSPSGTDDKEKPCSLPLRLAPQ